MKKFFSSLLIGIKSVVNFFWTHLDRLINIIVLTVSIIALWIAVKSMENQNSQFEQNSKSSDSLFQVQLMNSRELNDSLVSQLKTLQKITNSQLKITDEQLKLSNKTFNEKLYSERPILFAETPTMNDTNLIIDEQFSPLILLNVSNVGVRTAYKVIIRAFVLYGDSTVRTANPSFKTTNLIETNSISTLSYKTKIPLKYSYDFFYCIELKYYDEILEKYFYKYFYYVFMKDRNTLRFNNCNDREKEEVKNTLNNVLFSSNEPLFDK